MSIPGSAIPLLLKGAAAPTGYQISRSVRFNSSDSGFCSRTPASAGNRKTWTWAGWVKRSRAGVSNTEVLFQGGPGAGGNDSNYYLIRFDGSDRLDASSWNGAAKKLTTQVFRDLSAWYHIVFAFDSTQATAANRQRFYVNGVEVTTFTTDSSPTQNTDYGINAAVAHNIGREEYTGGSANAHFSGYLADIHFIDGQALDPTSFGEPDDNGVWQPIAYAGSYGTNGFHLPFSDNSTAAALGTDTSGNSNTWTVNNISVTAGAGNDSVVDSPTNGSQTDTGVGGEVVGNYCTWNPLNTGTTSLANGNLEVTTPSTGYGLTYSTIAVSSGKWYWEVSPSSITGNSEIGIAKAGGTLTSALGSYSSGYSYVNTALKGNNNSYTSYGVSYTTNDVIGVALDLDAGTLVFYKNGSSQGTAYSSLSGEFFPAVSDSSGSGGSTLVANFGQRPFAYTAPSGFKALCTTNLPEGTITTSGTFTGNALANGPFVYLNGVPTAMTINGNAVTFATHADKLSNGFKVRTSSASYNTAGSNTYSISTTGAKFKYARAQTNP